MLPRHEQALIPVPVCTSQVALNDQKRLSRIPGSTPKTLCLCLQFPFGFFSSQNFIAHLHEMRSQTRMVVTKRLNLCEYACALFVILQKDLRTLWLSAQWYMIN